MSNNNNDNDNTQFLLTVSFVVGLIGLLIFYFVDIKITKKKKNSSKTKKLLPPNSQPDKSLIQCDAIDCTNRNPSKKCGRCKMVYYCDGVCQKKHWKHHKVNCQTATEQIYAKLALQKEEIILTTIEQQQQQQQQSINNNNNNDNEEVPECSICLAKGKGIKHPITLKECKHTFCFSCLEQYQSYRRSLPRMEEEEKGSNNNNTPCPYCQTEVEDEDCITRRGNVLSKALLFATRAANPHITYEKKMNACALALEQMKTLGEPKSDQDIVQRNIICGQIAITKGDYKYALMIYQQNQRILTKLVQRKKRIDELLQRGEALGRKQQQQQHNEEEEDNDDDDEDVMDSETYQQMQQIQNEIMNIMAEGLLLGKESDLIDCTLECINVHLLMEDWEIAKNMYQQIMTDYPEQSMMSPKQQRKVFMGFAKCCYHLGNYEGCINLNNAAIQMNHTNRHYFPKIHEYIALSYKAMGNLQEAQNVMGRAVLYETTTTTTTTTPWWDNDDNDNHRSTAREMWIQLMEEGEGDIGEVKVNE